MRNLCAFVLCALFATFGLATTAMAENGEALPSYRDCSIASQSGSSAQLVTANPQRKYLLICNTGATNDNLGVNLAGGTAALSGTGTLTLVPGACKEYSTTGPLADPPANAVTAIGTSTQPVLCLEGR